MSLMLKSIELRNFRNHEHYVFTPRSSGITAICGVNGAGKSSIINGLAFALFGTKTTKKYSDLVRYDSTPEDDTFVAVEMSSGGVDLRVVRKLVGKGKSSAECDVYLKDANNKWKHSAGPAPSHANGFIKKYLRMGEKEFMSAVLVQQKQVDSLITASQKERGAVIERLTGIESLTKALEKARERSREAKKAVDNLGVDPKELKGLESALKSAQSKRDKLSDKSNKAQGKVDSAAAKFESAKGKRDELQQAYDDSVALVNAVEVSQARLSDLQAELGEKTKLKDAQRKLVAAIPDDDTQDAAQLGQELRKQRQLLQKVSSALAVGDNKLSQVLSQQHELEEFLSNSKLPSDTDELQSLLNSSQLKHDDISNKLQTVQVKIETAKADAQRYQRAAKVIADKNGTCPTCLQTVADPDPVVEMLQADANNALERKQALQEKLKKGQVYVDKLRARIEGLERALDAASVVRDNIDVIDQLMDSNSDLSEKKRALESAVADLQNKVDQAGKYAHDREEYQRLHAEVLKITKRIDVTQQELEEGQKSLKSLKVPTSKQLTDARTKTEDRLRALNEMKELAHEASTNLITANYEVSQLQDSVEAARDKEATYQAALRAREEAVAAETLVSEFRQNRIDQAIPEIGEYASQLIAQFTSGKFVALEISNTFIPSVIDKSGVKIPVASLSGGEMSAAALALRTAISLMLSGGASGLIILDEVLVSQDLERSESILYTIKDVCKGQVIMVAHSTIVEDVADQIITIGQVASAD